MILNSDLSFKIYTEDNNVLIGTYSVLNPETITLNGTEGKIGQLTSIEIIEGNISFEINLSGICQSILEGEKDETYEESKTYIADSEFEKYLIELGIDDVADNFVLTSKINSLDYLDLNERNITSLVGIEDFIGLEGLNASRNQISGVLDLSRNSKLVDVILPSNPIKKLYLKNNSALVSLYVYDTNTLEKLEISNSPQLIKLTAHNAKLQELDLTNSLEIFNLRIWDNQLNRLDLSFLSQLKYLVAQKVLNDSIGGEIRSFYSGFV